MANAVMHGAARATPEPTPEAALPARARAAPGARVPASPGELAAAVAPPSRGADACCSACARAAPTSSTVSGAAKRAVAVQRSSRPAARRASIVERCCASAGVPPCSGRAKRPDAGTEAPPSPLGAHCPAVGCGGGGGSSSRHCIRRGAPARWRCRSTRRRSLLRLSRRVPCRATPSSKHATCAPRLSRAACGARHLSVTRLHTPPCTTLQHSLTPS